MWLAKLLSLARGSFKFVSGAIGKIAGSKFTYIFKQTADGLKFITKRGVIWFGKLTKQTPGTLSKVKKLSVFDKVIGALGALSLGLSLKEIFFKDTSGEFQLKDGAFLEAATLLEEFISLVPENELEGDEASLVVDAESQKIINRSSLPVVLPDIDYKIYEFYAQLKDLALHHRNGTMSNSQAQYWMNIQQLARMNDGVAIVCEDYILHSDDLGFVTREGEELYKMIGV